MTIGKKVLITSGRSCYHPPYYRCRFERVFVCFVFSLYGMRRCGGCGAGIGASELVMRAKDMVYHISCFTCNSCGIQLSKGDHFGMRDHLIYCRVHYEALLETSPTTSPTMNAFFPTGAPHPAPTMEQYYGALGAPAPILDGIPKILPPINGTSPATGTSRGRPRKRRKESDASPTLSIGKSLFFSFHSRVQRSPLLFSSSRLCARLG